MFEIIDNPDKELRDEAENQLRKNQEQYGKRYCPCALDQTPEWVCPCKVFREQITEGECHCGRYFKKHKED